MKKIVTLLLVLVLSIGICGCADPTLVNGNEDVVKESSKVEETQKSNGGTTAQQGQSSEIKKEEEPTNQAILYIDDYLDDFTEYPFEYSGELTLDKLTKALTELTGYNFHVTASETSDGIIIDWAADSALLVGSEDAKEEFFVYDVEALTWLMLDSLYKTVIENLEVENVYYTMEGGKQLDFGTETYLNIFPIDEPYKGEKESKINQSTIIEMDMDTVTDIITDILKEKGQTEFVLVEKGYDIIQGEVAVIIAVGSNSADGTKFTATSHYAFTDYGNVFYTGFDSADWMLINQNNNEEEAGENTVSFAIDIIENLPSAATSLNIYNRPFEVYYSETLTDEATGKTTYIILAKNTDTGKVFARFIAFEDLTAIYRADEDMEEPILIYEGDGSVG